MLKNNSADTFIFVQKTWVLMAEKDDACTGSWETGSELQHGKTHSLGLTLSLRRSRAKPNQ